MAWDRSRYPINWLEISQRVRFERAAGKCEWTYPDGSRCDAPHGELIFRRRHDRERWRTPDASDLDEGGEPGWYGVTVMLTTAHTCDCDPPCGDESHLLALCQLHHLRLDNPMHHRHARVTRQTKKDRERGLFERYL